MTQRNMLYISSISRWRHTRIRGLLVVGLFMRSVFDNEKNYGRCCCWEAVNLSSVGLGVTKIFTQEKILLLNFFLKGVRLHINLFSETSRWMEGVISEFILQTKKGFEV